MAFSRVADDAGTASVRFTPPPGYGGMAGVHLFGTEPDRSGAIDLGVVVFE
ncbi:MAG: hypothetical protein ACI8PZ_001075 [Myxococcota bacterium]|jgi:hypothetical protein